MNMYNTSVTKLTLMFDYQNQDNSLELDGAVFVFLYADIFIVP